MKKNVFIFITGATILCVVLVCFFCSHGKWKRNDVNQETPILTSPPDTVMTLTIIDGKMLHLVGSFTPIISVFQEKLNRAAYCGNIAEQVPANTYPVSELQTNCFKKGCKVYHYEGEETEYYIVLNLEETECFYAEKWMEYRFEDEEKNTIEAVIGYQSF